MQAVKNTGLNVKDTKGIILHSNLGSQYSSQMVEDYYPAGGWFPLAEKGIPVTMPVSNPSIRY